MQEVFKSLSATIGNTPILSAKRFSASINAVASIYAKLEYFNPTGSIKDRAAFYMLRDAISSGKLSKDSTVIEPTSGNTGIGLASLCASIGVKCILTMPDNMSEERIKLLRRYGARVILTDRALGMQGSIDKAHELASVTEGAFIPSQFDNPSNTSAHYSMTGPEIWKQTSGNVDILVAGVGSGGTISGCGKYLKEKNPNIIIVAVEPAESPLLSGGEPGEHSIAGIGANFIPKLVDMSVIDEIIPVPSAVAIAAAKKFVRSEGALVGISSGAALAAASKLAVNEKYRGKKIVCICPDGGDRYYSTELFTD